MERRINTSNIALVSKVCGSISGNSGTFYRSSLSEVLRLASANPKSFVLTRMLRNQNIDIKKDSILKYGIWNSLVWSDIDIKQMFKSVGILDYRKMPTDERADKYISLIEEYFAKYVFPYMPYVYGMNRSTSGYGFHIWSYIPSLYVDGEAVVIDTCNSAWYYTALGSFIMQRFFQCVKEDAESEELGTEMVQVLKMLRDYEETADVQKKIFDTHSLNIVQNIRISPHSGEFFLNPQWESKGVDFEMSELQAAYNEAVSPLSKVVTHTHIKHHRELDLFGTQLSYDGEYTFNYTERYSLANTAVKCWGLEKALEVIHKIVPIEKQNETIAAAYTADRYNKEANYIGINILVHYGLLRRNDVVLSKSMDEAEMGKRFDEEIIIRKGTYITEYINDEWFTEHKVVMLYAPTGAGKSYCENHIVQWAKSQGRPVVILKPTRALINQEETELKHNKTLCFSGTRNKLKDVDFSVDVAVATYEQFNKGIYYIAPNAVVIADESGDFYLADYRAAFAESVCIIAQKIAEKNDMKFIMCTATPNYEVASLNPYTIHFKKDEKFTNVNFKVYDDGNGGLSKVKDYIANIVLNAKSNEHIFIYYSTFNENFVRKYGLEDKVDLYSSTSKDLPTLVKRNGWGKKNILLVSAFGCEGVNFKGADDTKVYIFGRNSIETQQALGRIRNKEAVSEYNIICCPYDINLLNFDGYMPIQYYVDNIAYDVDKIIESREYIRKQLKALNLEALNVKTDTLKQDGNIHIDWEIKTLATLRHFSQFKTYAMFLQDNNFIINGEIEYVNGNDLSLTTYQLDTFPISSFAYDVLNYNENRIVWQEYKSASHKKLKEAVVELRDNMLKEQTVEALDTFTFDSAKRAQYIKDNFMKVVDYCEHSQYKLTTLKRMAFYADCFKAKNPIYTALIYLMHNIQSDGIYTVDDKGYNKDFDNDLLIAYLASAIGKTDTKANNIKLFNSLKKEIYSHFLDKDALQWFIDNINGHGNESTLHLADYTVTLTNKIAIGNDAKLSQLWEYICWKKQQDSNAKTSAGAIGGAKSKRTKIYECIKKYTTTIKKADGTTITKHFKKGSKYTFDDFEKLGVRRKIYSKILFDTTHFKEV